ncbi:Swarming motility protein SwrC [Streptomyces sp. RB5]|uniref:Swarming motility protein SwrC n=1 Tax=Streptomyces smaragdinus TaxID=2585196 RepID=A0A7K0CPA6_9ACTN|nr:efflux RND transporter permease subunit [Streptomyces smaragdinus]MQY15326.1 Swarming motility protein SwrC [Streptomyces smaragdinus]
MSWLSRISLKQRALIALMAVVAVFFGAIAIPQLKKTLLPPIDLPIVSVIAPYPGAAPDAVEKQVVEPLEDGLQRVDGITGVTATASEGSAVLMAQFDYGNNTERLTADIQQAVNRVRPLLPDDVDPQVVAGSTDDIPAVVLAASSEGDDNKTLADKLDTYVVPALRDIDGVGQVAVDGVQQRAVTVTVDDAKLAQAGLNGAAVSQALQAGGVTLPAGAFTDGGVSKTVQTGGGYTSLDQIKELRVAPQGDQGKIVRLGDVAEVAEQPTDIVSVTRTNGTPSLGVVVTMGQDGSAVAISDAIKDKLPDLEKDLGAKAELTVVSDQGPQVSEAISALSTEGLLGLAFAVVIILVFLVSLRSTLVTAVSIPLSVLITLIVLWTQDMSLNMLTLGALTIAIGRVVDDSIVVLENIKRHLAYGTERTQAIVTAVREVAGAITASTLTTVAVFLPIGVVGGLVGAFFGPFSITVTVALLASLLVSLTVVPVLSYWFMGSPKTDGQSVEQIRADAEAKEAGSVLQRWYVPVLRFATRRRLTSVLIAVAVLVGTFGLAPLLKTNLFDQGEQQVLSISEKLEPGTSLEAADAAAKQIEAMIGKTDGIEDYQVTVGSSGWMAALGGGTGANQASFQMKLKEDADSTAVVGDLRDGLKKLGPGIGEATVAEGGSFGNQDLKVVVKGADEKKLRTASETVRKEVAKLDDVTDVTSDLAQSIPRVTVNAKPAAAEYGLNETTLGQAVTQAVRGAKAGEATIGNTKLDVLVKSEKGAKTEAELKALTLITKAGPVKVGDIATVRTVPGPVQKTRIDGALSATITAKPVGDNTGAVSQNLTKKLDELKKDLPDGVTVSTGGLGDDQDEAFTNLGLAMLAAIAIVFLLLVGTFRSIIQPLILLVSIPFASTGAIGLLVITGTPLGVPAMIGMLMLIGIVVTNAIVLIDLINQYRDQGYGVIEAVVEGGRHRLRPILMTALATIFALTPMALSITGNGGFISQPLAVVVIGGLVSSTLLTLLLVPTLYAMVELGKERRRDKKAAKREKSAAAELKDAAMELSQL